MSISITSDIHFHASSSMIYNKRNQELVNILFIYVNVYELIKQNLIDFLNTNEIKTLIARRKLCGMSEDSFELKSEDILSDIKNKGIYNIKFDYSYDDNFFKSITINSSLDILIYITELYKDFKHGTLHMFMQSRKNMHLLTELNVFKGESVALDIDIIIDKDSEEIKKYNSDKSLYLPLCETYLSLVYNIDFLDYPAIFVNINEMSYKFYKDLLSKHLRFKNLVGETSVGIENNGNKDNSSESLDSKSSESKSVDSDPNTLYLEIELQRDDTNFKNNLDDILKNLELTNYSLGYDKLVYSIVIPKLSYRDGFKSYLINYLDKLEKNNLKYDNVTLIFSFNYLGYDFYSKAENSDILALIYKLKKYFYDARYLDVTQDT